MEPDGGSDDLSFAGSDLEEDAAEEVANTAHPQPAPPVPTPPMADAVSPGKRTTISAPAALPAPSDGSLPAVAHAQIASFGLVPVEGSAWQHPLRQKRSLHGNHIAKASPASHRKAAGPKPLAVLSDSGSGSSSGDEDANHPAAAVQSSQRPQTQARGPVRQGAAPAAPPSPQQHAAADPTLARSRSPPRGETTGPIRIVHHGRDVAISPQAAAPSGQQPDRARDSDGDVEIAPGVRLADALASSATKALAEEVLEREAVALSNSARRAARAVGDITADMINDVQHLLMLFGCPFLVAPQEAESQCATLELLGLSQGSITDDNDVLLFGGRTVYRHMCSQAKPPTLYLAEDVERGLGLDRDKLINLAYLLGSDYNSGLQVGALPLHSSFLVAPAPGLLRHLRPTAVFFPRGVQLTATSGAGRGARYRAGGDFRVPRWGGRPCPLPRLVS
jgi:DNA excision repair protein ERCC-5